MATLKDQLKWKNRAIDLLLALDRIRDAAEDERELPTAIASTQAMTVKAELCLLSLRAAIPISRRCSMASWPKCAALWWSPRATI